MKSKHFPEDPYYCSCNHPWGYHDVWRGCTMPLDARGLPIMRTSDQVRSCGCGKIRGE